MEVKKLDHIGVVVKDLEKAIETCQSLLGLDVSHREEITAHGVKLAFLPIGDTTLELLEYAPGEPKSVLAKFQAEQGEGGPHIAIEVKGIREQVEQLKAAGIPFLGDPPQNGSRGSTIAFFHPSVTNGLLTELVEHPSDSEWATKE